jgi:hypothetical protein
VGEKESNRILGVSTAQWRQVDLQTQLQTTRLDAEGADRRCFGIEQSIFAAPHTPRIRLLSLAAARQREGPSAGQKVAILKTGHGINTGYRKVGCHLAANSVAWMMQYHKITCLVSDRSCSQANKLREGRSNV